MKTAFIIVISLILFSSIFAQEEEPKISSISISSGESSLSKGICGSVTVQTSEDWRLIFEVNQSYMQFMYGKDISWLYVAGSGGYFNNTPWIGPYLVATPTDWLTFTSWEGVEMGTDGKPNAKELNFYFAFNSAKISISYFYVQYAILHFEMQNPDNLPGGGISIPIGKYTFSIGADYSIKSQKPLFAGSLSMKF